jgi:lysophospholipid acyltransferase (LPLAT)-like uncharacterized protein
MSSNKVATKAARRVGGVIVPHQPKWYQRLIGWLIYAVLQCLASSLRYRFNDRHGYFDQPPNQPVIYCIWHNRLALCLIPYFRYARRRNQTRGMAAIVSASKDGAFLTAILEAFGVQPVRGSSSRRGQQALLELTHWAERGYDLAITPDGPRGPRYVIQDGVMSLAQLTGLPILPVVYNTSKKIQLKSWDRFQVPIPFSRCEVEIEKAVHVPREATDEQRSALRAQLEETLRGITVD